MVQALGRITRNMCMLPRAWTIPVATMSQCLAPRRGARCGDASTTRSSFSGATQSASLSTAYPWWRTCRCYAWVVVLGVDSEFMPRGESLTYFRANCCRPNDARRVGACFSPIPSVGACGVLAEATTHHGGCRIVIRGEQTCEAISELESTQFGRSVVVHSTLQLERDGASADRFLCAARPPPPELHGAWRGRQLWMGGDKENDAGSTQACTASLTLTADQSTVTFGGRGCSAERTLDLGGEVRAARCTRPPLLLLRPVCAPPRPTVVVSGVGCSLMGSVWFGVVRV